jgi:programmed cell death 8 (apoptosis-inducing factor)
MYDTLVTDMDADNGAILLAGGTVVEYEKVLLATGGNPRKLPNIPRELTDRVTAYRTV